MSGTYTAEQVIELLLALRAENAEERKVNEQRIANMEDALRAVNDATGCGSSPYAVMQAFRGRRFCLNTTLPTLDAMSLNDILSALGYKDGEMVACGQPEKRITALIEEVGAYRHLRSRQTHKPTPLEEAALERVYTARDATNASGMRIEQ